MCPRVPSSSCGLRTTLHSSFKKWALKSLPRPGAGLCLHSADGRSLGPSSCACHSFLSRNQERPSPSLSRQPVFRCAGLRVAEGGRALSAQRRGGGGGQEVRQWLVADPVRRPLRGSALVLPRQPGACCRCFSPDNSPLAACNLTEITTPWSFLTPYVRCCPLPLVQAGRRAPQLSASFPLSPQIQRADRLHALHVPPALQEPSPQAADHHELRPQRLHAQPQRLPAGPPAPGQGEGRRRGAGPCCPESERRGCELFEKQIEIHAGPGFGQLLAQLRQQAELEARFVTVSA